MIVFPNCKINLGLNIVSKRLDGFHDIETVFYPVQVNDALEIIANTGFQPSLSSNTISDKEITYTQSGLPIYCKDENNLCIKAYHLLKKDFPDLPKIKMHLHKAIPMGAGLGGGSADAAFALKLMNEQFQLGITNEKLIHYAEKLGSDCPFFIINQPVFATGKGEILEPISVTLTNMQLVIINPGIHVNTAFAFSKINPSLPIKSIQTIIKQPIHTWQQELKNDFENPVFELYPEIKKIKNNLYDSGAVYAAMSGSGSSVFGLFNTDKISIPPFPEHYFIKNFTL